MSACHEFGIFRQSFSQVRRCRTSATLLCEIGSIFPDPLRYEVCMPPDTLAQARRDYIENQSLVTSPTEIVHLLYKVAIDNMRAALDCLKSGDAMARARAVTKAEEAVDELILALDHSAGAQFTRTLA